MENYENGMYINSFNDLKEYYSNKHFENLSDKAYEILEEMIILYILKPDKIYSENQLSDMIEIGRTPVREAVKKLEYSHMVEIIPRHGIKITEVNFNDYLLQLEVRELVGKLVYSRASKFANLQERKELVNITERYSKAIDTLDELNLIRIDNELHKFISECAKNTFAADALVPLHSLSRRIFYMGYSPGNTMTKLGHQLQLQLMKEIAIGNNEKVEKIADDLFEHCRKIFKMQYGYEGI